MDDVDRKIVKAAAVIARDAGATRVADELDALLYPVAYPDRLHDQYQEGPSVEEWEEAARI